MNHDSTHCADYNKNRCPKKCYRAELTEDLRNIHYLLPVSYAHFKGTKECPICKNESESQKMKYRKKPVVIESFRLGIDCIPDWFMEKAVVGDAHIYGEPIKAKVKTLEGVMTANFGDFIIKGVKGEIYPCKADIFYATYEKCEDTK